MKKFLLVLALLVLPALALAQTNRVYEETRITPTQMAAYGNATGTAGAWRIWPTATSGGGYFHYQIPTDVCSNQAIDPKLYYVQNGTWANKTSVTFGMAYQVLSANGHHQGSYSGLQTRNNTSGLITNSTLQSVQFAQIPMSKSTAGGAILGYVYRKGQASTDTAGNTTIPVGLLFEVQRCRTK